jgi:hypothetical protein
MYFSNGELCGMSPINIGFQQRKNAISKVPSPSKHNKLSGSNRIDACI